MIIKRKAKKTLQISYTMKSYFTGATATRKSHPRFSSFPTELPLTDPSSQMGSFLFYSPTATYEKNGGGIKSIKEMF